MQTTNRFWPVLLLVGLLGGGAEWLVNGGKAGAQEPRPAFAQLVKEGQALAERLCVSCHAMDGRPGAVVPAGVPSLRGIANTPGQTGERIRGLLRNPHPPMPDVNLSYPEIDRLLAYLESIRTPSSSAPLAPRTDRDKPLYPDPS